MKKDKNSLKQKIVIAIACLVIVACTISMTTMAWFTDTMQGTTNLTFGKIKLSDDFTHYTFNTPEAPAVASRKINDGDWTIVLDETSNDAFIRLIAKYGAPIKYVLTTDPTYLPNKAYYNSSYEKLEAVESNPTVGEEYVVGDPITSPNSTVYECKYSLDYITSGNINNEIGDSAINPTFAKIIQERFTTQYYPVVSAGVLGSNFLKGVKYYAFVGGQFRALIGSTTYDANTDYYYGMLYTDFDPNGDTTADTVYVAYNYSTSGVTATHKIVDVTDPDTDAVLYQQLVETDVSPSIGIAVNSQVGAVENGISANRYTIYNAYIDWLIQNVALPETPEAVGYYYTEVNTDGETPVGEESTKGTYAFIKSADTAQGTAEYYLASDLLGTALNAVRTEVIDENIDDSVTNKYVFAEDGAIKIKDSADQITLKSATLTAITSSEDLATAVGVTGDPAKVLVKDANGFYTLYDGESYAADTFYIYSGDVTVINGHVYFLTTGVNGTPVELKYAQKDLGLGLSVDIQAIQTILSRKVGQDDADPSFFGESGIQAGDKLTIAIMTAADCTALSINVDNAGKLGAYKNGTIQRIATIADIAPYFEAQFGAAN